MKKILCLCSIFLMLSGVQTVFAQENSGQLNIILCSQDNTALRYSDYSVKLYSVNPMIDVGSDMAENVAGLIDVPIEWIGEEELDSLAESIVKLIRKNQIDAFKEGITDSNGEISFTGLEEGVYLVMIEAAEKSFQPYLVWLPMKNAQGDSVYEITSYPKLVQKNESIENNQKTSTADTSSDIHQQNINTGVNQNMKLVLMFGTALILSGFFSFLIVLRSHES